MIKIIALDLGGVLAYQDYSKLSNHEKLLLNIYLGKNYSNLRLQKKSQPLFLEVEEKIEDIYSKIYNLTDESMKCLEFIKSSGYQSSLWTNNRTAINKWLRGSGITDYISPKYICNSCYMPTGTNKPDIRFYISALKQIQTLPQHVLFIDDDLKNIKSAECIGISTLHYSDPHQNLTVSIQEKIKKLERRYL